MEARRLYDQARDASRRLISFYRDISGAFRGLDARIPREMDDKGRQALNLLTRDQSPPGGPVPSSEPTRSGRAAPGGGGTHHDTGE